MPKIVTVEQMRAIEAAANEHGFTYAQMMQQAGRATAERIKQVIDRLDPHVVILIGKGNNGGDGLVVADILARETQCSVSVYLSAPRTPEDLVYAPLLGNRVQLIDGQSDAEQGFPALKAQIQEADLIVDALLGTGAKLPLNGIVQSILQQVNAALTVRRSQPDVRWYNTPAHPAADTRRLPKVLAVDMPTGMDADTGALDPDTIVANETITFEAAKPGHLLFPAAEAVGTLLIAPLGLPADLEALAAIRPILVDADTVRPLVPRRPLSASKVTFGKVMIAAGSANYTGAAALSSTAAYRIGAGLVTVAAPQSIVPILAGKLLEATWLLMPHDLGVLNREAARALRAALNGYTALLIGPGLTQERATGEFIETFFNPEPVQRPATGFGFAGAAQSFADQNSTKNLHLLNLPPMVIDADGLNLLAKLDRWWTRIPHRTILTPHTGEFARLSKIVDDANGKATEKVSANRVKLAAEKAVEWGMVVVLKGAFTVIADPDGRLAVLPFANPALARAGTGDVLAGTIAGLLGQRLDPFDAAMLGAYLHGLAGELAIRVAGNRASVLANEVANQIPIALGMVTGESF